MSFSFNFVIDEDEAGDNASPGASAEAQLIGTTKPAEHDNESANSGAVPDLVPGKRLVLDSDSDTSLEMKVPSSKLVIRLSSAAPSDAQEGGGVEGTELREFIKVDEERAAIGDHLLNLLYDDDTQTHKDLVPRQYEGGLKVWEASLDLVRYLHRMKTIQRHPLFELNDDDQPVPDRASSGSSEKSASSSGGKVKVGAGCVQEEASDEAPEKAVPVAAQKAKAKAPIRVLELGCGHGFPGLYVLQEANVAHCAFTDYNEAVLRTVTWPTVLVNARGAGNSAPTMDLRFRARYYAGDWVRAYVRARLRRALCRGLQARSVALSDTCVLTALKTCSTCRRLGFVCHESSSSTRLAACLVYLSEQRTGQRVASFARR